MTTFSAHGFITDKDKEWGQIFRSAKAKCMVHAMGKSTARRAGRVRCARAIETITFALKAFWAVTANDFKIVLNSGRLTRLIAVLVLGRLKFI